MTRKPTPRQQIPSKSGRRSQTLMGQGFAVDEGAITAKLGATDQIQCNAGVNRAPGMIQAFLPPADVERWNREQAAKPTKH